ncbi:MAG: OB-fold nucleic acid binding domain-containing protein [Deltaproteobacteria bacterium]|nr:OB-fold nucleic acid binding domain-containing protein [Deltaproteobacteria bacterium]
MTFFTGLALVASLLLWNPLQANAGAGMGGPDDQSMQGVSGKVLETMNSGGYTYVLVEKGGAKTWVALPQSAITVGSEIACQPGMEMNNFKSTSLNRSFESIVFSEGLAPVGPVAAPAPAAPSTPSEAITVSKAEGANAQTVGEIFEKKDALANKPVAVQGKVIKVSRGIMGKNWLHLQDGTGSQATGTNDLVVTTDSLPEVGKVVTIKGNLSRNRDFGAGYRYGVIIENAEVTGSK